LETFERGLAGGSEIIIKRPEDSMKYEKYRFRKGVRGMSESSEIGSSVPIYLSLPKNTCHLLKSTSLPELARFASAATVVPDL
jgi:hypothetical protein